MTDFKKKQPSHDLLKLDIIYKGLSKPTLSYEKAGLIRQTSPRTTSQRTTYTAKRVPAGHKSRWVFARMVTHLVQPHRARYVPSGY